MIYLVLITLIFLFLRLFIWEKSRHVAIDQYFWTEYRAAKRACRGEVELPQYLLDLRQWYVPMFGRFLALLPDRIFRNSSALMLGISFIRFGLVLLWAELFIGSVTQWVALSGAVVFLSSPITAIHDNQLNGRIGGAILFDLLLAVGVVYSHDFSSILLVVMVALVCLLFFLHKLTLQLFLVCSLFFLLLGYPGWMLALLGGGLLAFLLGYRKYALAHWDISSFWFRNRNKLSAHQIDQSPIYSKPNNTSSGWKAAAFHSATLVGMCPWVVLIILAHVPWWSMVCVIILSISCCISFVPIFKCWGHGRNYTYYFVAPVIYGLATLGEIAWAPVGIFLVIGVFVVIILSMWQYFSWLKVQSGASDAELNEMLAVLSGKKVNRICCIPFSMADQAASISGCKVFWGGHGYGFKWIEPYFPVFNHPVERAVEEWNLGGMLVRKSYWPDFVNQVDQSKFVPVMENAGYLLLAVVGWQPGNRIPEWARNAYPALKDQLPDDGFQ